METFTKLVITIVVIVVVRYGWKVLNWVWFKPKKLEKWLRNEGYNGNSYKLLFGDMIELATMVKEGRSKPMSITHDITSYALPFDHHIITKYGINPIYFVFYFISFDHHTTWLTFDRVVKS